MHWILGLGLAALLFIVLKRWGALDPTQKKAATWKLALAVAGVLLLLMVLTGRVHVLVAAVAALVPLLRRLPSLLQFMPHIRRLFGKEDTGPEQGRENRSSTASSGQMSEREACEVLNVKPGCSRDEIVAAHRRLMQKLHPDRGGNDYLAAKVNEAKTVLLGKRGSRG
ncbi:DnaJ domain-containing protein [Marinobacter daqiaonensis]|uniref:DnaJ domain-containing protein n=1 Tax=Marinobacter daqiaonensis TaxID=650891 RepID=A0A1I6JTB6_9GAMM|nr:DnaJ domain-containing protein [Marinobacter daqiaonensis]SFR82234.1 DnaJ domain-containing protein [Marinobacter daqiaonensis]